MVDSYIVQALVLIVLAGWLKSWTVAAGVTAPVVGLIVKTGQYWREHVAEEDTATAEKHYEALTCVRDLGEGTNIEEGLLEEGLLEEACILLNWLQEKLAAGKGVEFGHTFART